MPALLVTINAPGRLNADRSDICSSVFAVTDSSKGFKKFGDFPAHDISIQYTKQRPHIHFNIGKIQRSALRMYGGLGGFFPWRGTIDGSAGDGIGDSSIWCMPYRAEKLDEKDGDSSAPSGGGALRIVLMAGSPRRDDNSIVPVSFTAEAGPNPSLTVTVARIILRLSVGQDLQDYNVNECPAVACSCQVLKEVGGGKTFSNVGILPEGSNRRMSVYCYSCRSVRRQTAEAEPVQHAKSREDVDSAKAVEKQKVPLSQV